LAEIWDLLRNVTVVSFEARSAAQTGWNGAGTGSVAVSEPSPGVLVFAESGSWQPHGRRDIRFSNVFRWSRLEEALRLEHLRFGPERPVFLFDLAPVACGEWREVSPHACGEDCYSGSLSVQGRQVLVHWLIRGPRKDESIRYVYQ
jgi:hypothetical protein